LAAANKRIRNILRKVEGGIPAQVDAGLLKETAERDLATAVAAAIADTDPMLAARDYVGVLRRLAALRVPVDAFFDGVMVNADDAALRVNRLALLGTLHASMNRVADLARLAT
jgi:glycyl-tRNA synthetase beta chain